MCSNLPGAVGATRGEKGMTLPCHLEDDITSMVINITESDTNTCAAYNYSRPSTRPCVHPALGVA